MLFTVMDLENPLPIFCFIDKLINVYLNGDFFHGATLDVFPQ